MLCFSLGQRFPSLDQKEIVPLTAAAFAAVVTPIGEVEKMHYDPGLTDVQLRPLECLAHMRVVLQRVKATTSQSPALIGHCMWVAKESAICEQDISLQLRPFLRDNKSVLEGIFPAYFCVIQPVCHSEERIKMCFFFFLTSVRGKRQIEP